jgi:hypothetical protein
VVAGAAIPSATAQNQNGSKPTARSILQKGLHAVRSNVSAREEDGGDEAEMLRLRAEYAQSRPLRRPRSRWPVCLPRNVRRAASQ